MKNVRQMQPAVRKKRLMLVLPLLIIPFLTMAFWAMGGGKGSPAKMQTTIQGLNLNLPDPKQKDEKFPDKLSFYDKAEKDSLKLAEYMRSDPYYKEKPDTMLPVNNELEELTQTTASKYNQKLNLSPYEKTKMQPEQQVMQKLNLLQNELNKNSTSDQVKDTYPATQSSSPLSSDVDRLENMMNIMNKDDTEDPEMKQLNGTLEKILDIQHPERIKERKKPKDKGTFIVETRSDSSVVGFYGYSNETENVNENAIEAVVNENQSLVNGAVIKLRLANDVFINSIKIPMGTLVFGLAQLDGERLNIEINSIKYRKFLFDVKLEVYDMDGLPGIYIPGAISRDVAKQGINNSLSIMDITSVDPSIKAQATAAGIGTLKNLLSKKVKLTRVIVKAGYKLLLKNKSNL